MAPRPVSPSKSQPDSPVARAEKATTQYPSFFVLILVAEFLYEILTNFVMTKLEAVLSKFRKNQLHDRSLFATIQDHTGSSRKRATMVQLVLRALSALRFNQN